MFIGLCQKRQIPKQNKSDLNKIFFHSQNSSFILIIISSRNVLTRKHTLYQALLAKTCRMYVKIIERGFIAYTKGSSSIYCIRTLNKEHLWHTQKVHKVSMVYTKDSGSICGIHTMYNEHFCIY